MFQGIKTGGPGEMMGGQDVLSMGVELVHARK